MILGDSIHNFCDGIIIAAAFLADTRLGVVTSLAIIAHEIPQEVGDYIVLLNAGFSRAKALLFNALSGLAAVVGGVVGYFVVGPWQALFPYLLVIAASSFIYVAVADLIPQLQHRLTLKETVAQLIWLGAAWRSSCWRSASCADVAALARRQRTTSTGTVVCLRTSWVSLPRNSDARPLRPCEPITSRSQCCSAAWATIASHGCKPSTVCAWQAMPAASQASTTART